MERHPNASGLPETQERIPIQATAATEEKEHRESRRLRVNYDDLHDAIRRGDFDSTKKILEEGANVERDTDDGKTPLVIALNQYRIDIMKLLLARGADVNHPAQNWPPIFHAVAQGERAPQIIQLLLDHGADLEATTSTSDMNALHLASVKGMVHAVDFLVSKGSDMNRTWVRGKTPLILAAENGHLTVVKLMLAKGADLHGRSSNDGTALMWAAKQGHHEVVRYLLDVGSRVDDRGNDGITALSLASTFGHLEVAELLIKRGADVNARSVSPMNCTPAIFAAESGHAAVLQILLSNGADPTIIPGDGCTILEVAMEGGHLATVRILLEALGGPDYPKDSVALQMAIAQSNTTVRALMTAVSITYQHAESNPTGSENLAWIKWVLDQGGELVRPKAMCSMLHVALADGDSGVAAELLKLGANPNGIGFTGNTPLHVVVDMCKSSLIEILLNARADPAKLSEKRKGLNLTPLHYAVLDYETGRAENVSVIDLLLSSGRCSLMEGKDAQSTVFACVVSAFDRGKGGVVADLALRMLDSIPDVNDDRSDDGSTLMHVAVYYKEKGLIDALRRKGVAINAKNMNGLSPLLAACQIDAGLVNFLVTRCADASAVNKHEEGALHIAAACGQIEVLKFLLDLDLADEELLNINAVDDIGHTPLISAIVNNHEDAALFLLERGACTQYRTTDKGRVAIHYAAQFSMQSVVEKMLEAPCIDTINIEDHRGYTPLALACMAPTPTVVPDLLSHGADANTVHPTTGDRPLHIALKRPCHMDRLDAKYSSPSLDLLKHKDVDITARDANGRTPLHLASEFHNLLATQVLLSKGVSLRNEDDGSRTPLCLCSRPDVAKALIEHGANIDHGDVNGWTPLHYAVSRCWVKAFVVLRQAGADMDVRTQDDGLDVKERLEGFGTWADWVDTERDFVCDDARRERMREVAMRKEMGMEADLC